MIDINSFLKISYSRLSDLAIPMNTREVFEAACRIGFDGVKADVTPSSDGKLILCHDPHFAFDENGRVVEPGVEGEYQRMINEIPFDECTGFEYAHAAARENLGYYAHVAGLEDMLQVCAEYGKIPYITVRDYEIELCVNEVYRLIKKYGLAERTIINSFSPETLGAMREKDESIKLSYVWGPDIPLTKEVVDTARSLGNCVICLFMWRDSLLSGEICKKSEEAMLYAKECGVPLHLAHGYDIETYEIALKQGFTGFQCFSTAVFKKS